MPDVRVEIDPETADALQTETELLGFDGREAYLAWIVENRAAIEQGTESAELLSSYRERLLALEERLAAAGVDPDEVDGRSILDEQGHQAAESDGAPGDAADGTDDSAADESADDCADAPVDAPAAADAQESPDESEDASTAPSDSDASLTSGTADACGPEAVAQDEPTSLSGDDAAGPGDGTVALPDDYDEPRVLDLDANGFYVDDLEAADAEEPDAEDVDAEEPDAEDVDAEEPDAEDLDADDRDDDLDAGGSNADVTGYSDAAVGTELDADAADGPDSTAAPDSAPDATASTADAHGEQAASDGGSPTGSQQPSVTGADVTSMHLEPERVQRVSEDPVSEDAGELSDVETNRVDELSRRAVARTREELDRDVETGLSYDSSPAVPSSDVRPGEDLAELDGIDVPGRSEQVVTERREVVGHALAFLRDEGEARRSAFVDALYEEHPAGYETADGWWRCVREGLRQVDAVDGGHVWAYED